jgi:hypothetical protein
MVIFTYGFWVAAANSAIWGTVGPQGSIEVAFLVRICIPEYPLQKFLVPRHMPLNILVKDELFLMNEKFKCCLGIQGNR